MYPHNRSIFLSAILLLSGTIFPPSASAQAARGIWQDEKETAFLSARSKTASKRTVVPRVYRTLNADRAALGAVLATAKQEFSRGEQPSTELALPMPDGSFARFTIEESPIMDPKLAAKFPEIKTYVGQGIDDPSLTARLDQTPQGFHAIIFTGSDSVYIDPYWRDDTTKYLSYRRSDFSDPAKSHKCRIHAADEDRPPLRQRQSIAAKPTGTSLRTYRMAVACTGEYAAAAGGGTVLGALGAIVTTVNRVSAVYERDLSIRLRLVANQEQIIFTNPETDGFSDSNADRLIDQSQTKIDAIIGNANYDIGHTFSTGGGGLAGLGVVGRNGRKAEGVTGSSNPVGDPYDIDYVAHEVGHQFGAEHTFNGTTAGSSRNGSTAYEPGSGSTIMAYAGIMEPQDVALSSDDYFHTSSYDEIDAYTSGTSPGNVGVPTATGNTPPTIGALRSFTIPNQTPFYLTANATDLNPGDVLTYCWEQFDRGPAQNPTVSPRDNGSSPLFRSFDPTTSPVRIFPSLTYILNNANVPPAKLGDIISGEFLPTTNRTMTFRVTVRDNRLGGGGSNYASTSVTSTTSAGPFKLTSFNTPSTIAGGSSQMITWAVANTTASPVNCANVKISLSTDGGYTFPFVLASSTPNDGSQSVSIPNVANVATTQGRFKVEAVDNIFFDLSGAATTITSTNTAPVLTITKDVSVQRATPTATVANVATVSDTNTPLTASLSGVPADTTLSVSLSGNNVVVSARAAASISTTNNSRSYPVVLTVTDSLGSTTSGIFNLIVRPNPTPTLGTYTDKNVSAGGIATAAPAAGPQDANNNLGTKPLSVTPATLPGGGTLTVNQITGVVTATTLSTTALGKVPVRVTVQDTAGAASVRGFNLTISGPTDVLSVTSTVFSTVGPQGGPFSPTARTYTLTNKGNSAINWTASKTQPWTTLSSTGGSLAAGASIGVTVSLNSAANSLALGIYTDSVNFRNENSGVVQKRTVTLTVSGNDSFANATVLPGRSGTIKGNNASATKQSGEPNHAGNAGGHSLWYKWTAPSSGSVAIDTNGSSFDTTLGVYTGSAVDRLTRIASNDDGGIGKQSALAFNAVAGTVYRIAVDGYRGSSGSGATGNFVLNYAQATANRTLANSAVFSGTSSTGIAPYLAAKSLSLSELAAVGLFDLTDKGAGQLQNNTVTRVEWINGRKYLTMLITKTSGERYLKRTVEVSSNLLDWYSGKNHTTILQDDATLLKVRDNTPVTPETKRYIRLK